jgi:hypothetical protein
VDGYSGTDPSSREPASSDRSSEIYAAAAELLELLFELCIAFMTEEFRDGQPSSSTLVYYSGILLRYSVMECPPIPKLNFFRDSV